MNCRRSSGARYAQPLGERSGGGPIGKLLNRSVSASTIKENKGAAAEAAFATEP